MPLTPQQALQRGKQSRLSDDEAATFVRIKEAVDERILEHWTAGPFQTRIESCSGRVAAYLMRAYYHANWQPAMAAIDGSLAKAQDILANGGEVEWVLTLIPDWRAERG